MRQRRGRLNGSRDERTSTSVWISRRRGPSSWASAGVHPNCSERRQVTTRRRKLEGPANALIEAAGADPFGDCQVEDTLIGALRACADIHAALAQAEAASRERPADTLLNEVHLPIRRAAIELRRNRPDSAITLLESARPFERRYTEVVYLRGLAYLRMGKARRRRREFRKIIDHKGATWGPRYAQAHLGLARAAVQAGDSAGARKAYSDFLTLWKDADADIPLLIEAKKEYAALR